MLCPWPKNYCKIFIGKPLWVVEVLRKGPVLGIFLDLGEKRGAKKEKIGDGGLSMVALCDSNSTANTALIIR